MESVLRDVISQSHIWDGDQAQSHAFLLSPSVYEINRSQHEELSRLGFALHDCLLGLSHMAVIAYDNALNYGGHWKYIRQIFSSGVPHLYHETQGKNVEDIPRLLKVDLMVGQGGNFRIAEIDGHNKHGLGYSTLGARLCRAACPSGIALPGAVRKLSEEIRRLGYSEFVLLFADRERFYIPEMKIAVDEFARWGIDCRLISELRAQEEDVTKGLLLDFPFLTRRPALSPLITQAYFAGDVRFIIPPKPFLGAKGVLALLRNDTENREIEAVLRTFIPARSLDLLRSYIPETFFVGKKAMKKENVLEAAKKKRYVLKESISSGMKGTVFSDGDDFLETLEEACAANINWILQEEVVNRPFRFSWYENGSSKTAGDWFLRVTAHYINRDLADIIATARRDKAVHGAKDALQLGTVII